MKKIKRISINLAIILGIVICVLFTALTLVSNEVIKKASLAETKNTLVDTVLSNSFGFGGTNSALILRKL